MICQVCGKNDATICMIRMSNNAKETVYMCGACAGKLEDQLLGDLNSLLGPMLGGLAGDAGDLEESHLICPGCGQTKREFEESGLMNCSDCYSFFRSEKFHAGKVPGANREELILINLIKEKEQQLKKLVTEEKYEEAAVLRDEIRGLKEDQSHEQ